MSKLGSKELLLILLIINFLMYYFAYMLAVGPLKNEISTLKTQSIELQQERDEKQATVDKKPEYEQNIKDLTEQKKTLFQTGFPNTDPEFLHAFMVDQSKAANIQIDNISIAQAPRTSVNSAGETVETGIMDNTITISTVAPYNSIAKLLDDIEKMQRTSILTSLNISGTAGSMSSNMSYNFLSADKGEDINDTVFNHTFSQGAGNSTLFK